MTKHFIDWYKVYLKLYSTYKRTQNLDLSEFKFIDPILILLLFKNLITVDNGIITHDANVKNYLDFLIKNYNNVNNVVDSYNYIL